VTLAIGFGLTLWLALAVALRPLPWTAETAFLANIAIFAVGMAATRSFRRHGAPRAAASRWWDVPLRAALVATLVALVTTFSLAIGPTATGYAAVFPIAMTSLALILYVRLGGRAVAGIMSASFLPMAGFSAALLTLHYTAPVHGAAIGLVAALCASLGWSMALVVWRMWTSRRKAA
jgi:hypothetical protein